MENIEKINGISLDYNWESIRQSDENIMPVQIPFCVSA